MGQWRILSWGRRPEYKAQQEIRWEGGGIELVETDVLVEPSRDVGLGTKDCIVDRLGFRKDTNREGEYERIRNALL